MIKVVDASNYTDYLQDTQLNCWRDNNVGLVVVQAVDPPAPYPKSKTKVQLGLLERQKFPYHIYTYLWWSNPGLAIQNLHLSDGFNQDTVWIDVEETNDGRNLSVADRIRILHQIVDQIRSQFNFKRIGIYTSIGLWKQLMGDTTEFSDLLLWDANWDYNEATFDDFVPYGGWTECVLKQYRGTSSLCDVGGIDLSIANETKIFPTTVPDERLAHLDAAWGWFEQIKQEEDIYKDFPHLARWSQNGQNELILLKGILGLDTAV